MSSSNPINLFNLDGRYTSPSQVDIKIAAQASTDSNQYATQSSVTGKASKGANADITSLTGLTTALSIAQGGTGTTMSTGSGANVLATSPTLVTPALGTPSAAVLTNATGLPLATGVTGMLPLASGGTGATSASAARLALGVDASGTQEPTLSVVSWSSAATYVKGQLVISPYGAFTASVTSLMQATTALAANATINTTNWTQLADIGLPVGVTSGTVAAGNDSRLVASATNTANITALTLNPTVTQTAAYTANAQDLVLANANSAAFTVTLPTTPADKTLVEVKKLDASTNIVTVQTGGSDTYAIGGTSVQLALQGQAITLRYQASSTTWIALQNDLPFAATEARYLTQANAISTYAPKANPSFTGTVTVTSPTASTSAATKAYVDSAQSSVVGINTQSTSYTLILSDAGKQIEYTSSSAGTFTIPLNASVAFSIGTVIQLFMGGAGPLTVVIASGGTLLSPAGFRLTTQYASATIIQRATDVWILSGFTVS